MEHSCSSTWKTWKTFWKIICWPWLRRFI